MPQDSAAAGEAPKDSRNARNPRAKYATLTVLLVWVAAVFVFTLFKFSGGSQ